MEIEMGRWTTIRKAPWMELEVLRGALMEEGVAAHIPDMNTKLMDPFATGSAQSLMCTLQVPESQVERALGLIESVRADGPARLGETTTPIVPLTPEEIRARDLDDRGRRIRWASILGVTYPIAVFQSIRYFEEIEAGVERPSGHRLTLVGLLLVGPIEFGILAFTLLLSFTE